MTTAPDHRGTDALLAAVAGRVRLIELGQPFFTGMPCSPNHPGFRMTLIRRHGDMVRPDGGSAANEIIVTGGHVGTHVDALVHVSHDGLLHGGVDAGEAQTGGRVQRARRRAHARPAHPRRAARRRRGATGVDACPRGYGVTAADLDGRGGPRGRGAAARATSRWSAPAGPATSTTPPAYLGQEAGVPGATTTPPSGWPPRGVVATGADTTAYEQIPAGRGAHACCPCTGSCWSRTASTSSSTSTSRTSPRPGSTEFLVRAGPAADRRRHRLPASARSRRSRHDRARPSSTRLAALAVDDRGVDGLPDAVCAQDVARRVLDVLGQQPGRAPDEVAGHGRHAPLVGGWGGREPRHRDRAGPRAARRRAAALVNGTLAHSPRLRRHPPAVGPAPLGVRRARRAGGGRGDRRQRGGAARRGRRRHRGGRAGSAWPATTRRSATRCSSSADCTPPRSAARSGRAVAAATRRGLDAERRSRTRSAIAASHGLRAARGQPHRRHGQARALRMGRPRGRRRRRPGARTG